MQTTLMTHDLGPVTLAAPRGAPRHVRATHGHLWQWIGDGEELLSLSVAVRTTQLGTPTGARHHLSWEVEQVQAGMDPGPDAGAASDVLVAVEGARGAAAADVAGRVRGSEVRNRLVVATDGLHMHVVRALVADTESGRELAEAVTAALRVREWSMTS